MIFVDSIIELEFIDLIKLVYSNRFSKIIVEYFHANFAYSCYEKIVAY